MRTINANALRVRAEKAERERNEARAQVAKLARQIAALTAENAKLKEPYRDPFWDIVQKDADSGNQHAIALMARKP